MSDPEGVLVVPARSVDAVLAWYEKQPWLRAIVQIVPVGGGSVDTLLAWRGTALAQARFAEFVAEVSARLGNLEASADRDQFLQSEQFVELFVTTADAVVKSSSAEKRRRAAAFLAGTIADGRTQDLSQQIADDLSALRDLHLQIIAGLASDAGFAVLNDARGAVQIGLPIDVYQKGLADLTRFGFIQLHTDQIGTWGAGAPQLQTTEYLSTFKRAIQDDRVARA